MADKKKLEYKPKKSESWERIINALLNSNMDVSFYPKDGQIYVAIKDESMYSIILNKDGTWGLG